MKKITANLFITSIQSGNIEMASDFTKVEDFYLSFKFYGLEYNGHILFQSLIDDSSYDFSLEGDSELFESFEEQIQVNFTNIKYHITEWAKSTYDDLIIPEITVEA